jgi:hypothetical protein
LAAFGEFFDDLGEVNVLPRTKSASTDVHDP